MLLVFSAYDLHRAQVDRERRLLRHRSCPCHGHCAHSTCRHPTPSRASAWDLLFSCTPIYPDPVFESNDVQERYTPDPRPNLFYEWYAANHANPTMQTRDPAVHLSRHPAIRKASQSRIPARIPFSSPDVPARDPSHGPKVARSVSFRVPISSPVPESNLSTAPPTQAHDDLKAAIEYLQSKSEHQARLLSQLKQKEKEEKERAIRQQIERESRQQIEQEKVRQQKEKEEARQQKEKEEKARQQQEKDRQQREQEEARQQKEKEEKARKQQEKDRQQREEKEKEALEAANEQARLIKRYDSLASLTSIRSDFLAVQEAAQSSSTPSSVQVSAPEFSSTPDSSLDVPIPDSSLDTPTPVPDTIHTAHSTKAYEESLFRFLERLDGVDSDGDEVIRFARRGLVKEVEGVLEGLERESGRAAVDGQAEAVEGQVDVDVDVDGKAEEGQVEVGRVETLLPSNNGSHEYEEVTPPSEEAGEKIEIDIERSASAPPVLEQGIQTDSLLLLGEGEEEETIEGSGDEVKSSGIPEAEETEETEETTTAQKEEEVSLRFGSQGVQVPVQLANEREREDLHSSTPVVEEEISHPAAHSQRAIQVSPAPEHDHDSEEVAISTSSSIGLGVEGVTHTFPPSSAPLDESSQLSFHPHSDSTDEVSESDEDAEASNKQGSEVGLDLGGSPQQALTDIGSDVVLVLTDESSSDSSSEVEPEPQVPQSEVGQFEFL